HLYHTGKFAFFVSSIFPMHTYLKISSTTCGEEPIISFSGNTPTIFPAIQLLVAKGIPFISVTNLKNNHLARMTPFNLYANSSSNELSDDTKLNTFASFFIIGEMLFSHYVDYLKQLQNEEKNGEQP
ncbi:SIS domain-containing protein, partial [Geobacillus stearothermophilus]|uniref:SIS domain-containing protein n=1 Tax=Geobacillus stearothermophilus TaxID=1422 RepID=UPI002E24D6C6